MKPVLDLPTDTGLTWLTYAELADYLKYRGTHRAREARRWVTDHGIRKYYRSAKRVLIKRAEVDAVLEHAE